MDNKDIDTNLEPVLITMDDAASNNDNISSNEEPIIIDEVKDNKKNKKAKVKKEKVKKEKIKKDRKTTFKVKESSMDDNTNKKVIYLFPKKIFDVFTLFVIVGLMFYIAYLYLDYENNIKEIKYSCTPASVSSPKELDINSTLVQDLYKKVKTNLLEDYAQPTFDNSMKLYLAYRQILDSDKYESNCTLFKEELMEPYRCNVNGFTPRAFKADTLILEWKKLFGEETPIELDNIKLKNSCIGGFQYIPERDEFVEGYCDYNVTTSFKVTKSLKEATTSGNTIILKEYVKYKENEKQEKPSYLKSGTYIYTFKLDMNYNYVLVSKTYDDKY